MYNGIVYHPKLLSFPTRRSSDLEGTHPCLPLSEWIRFFHETISQPHKHDLFSRRELFDIRELSGDPSILAELRSEEHTSELQSRFDLVCRLLLEKKK